jgi:hypothetical protein
MKSEVEEFSNLENSIARWLEIQLLNLLPLYPLETLTFHLLLIVWVRGRLLCFVGLSQAQNILEIVVMLPVHSSVNCNGIIAN